MKVLQGWGSRASGGKTGLGWAGIGTAWYGVESGVPEYEDE